MLTIIDSGLSIYRLPEDKGDFKKEYAAITSQYKQIIREHFGREVVTLKELAQYVSDNDFHKGDTICLAYPLFGYNKFTNITLRLVKMIKKLDINIIMLTPTTFGLDHDYMYNCAAQFHDIESFERFLNLIVGERK